METFNSQALALVKDKLGITTHIRDPLLYKIVEGVTTELIDEKGITLDESNPNHLMFVVDYSTWRYMSKDQGGALPPNLRLRFHNLMLHNGGVQDGTV